MAKVIKLPPPETPVQTTCPECHAVIEYTRSDIKSDWANTRKKVSCPCCKHDIVVFSKFKTDLSWCAQLRTASMNA